MPAARATLIRPSAASPVAEPGVSSSGAAAPPSSDDEIGRALAEAAEQRARLAAALADESRWRLVIDCGFVHTLTAHKEVRQACRQGLRQGCGAEPGSVGGGGVGYSNSQNDERGLTRAARSDPWVVGRGRTHAAR